MICYPGGTEAKVRDRVRIDHGASPAVVHAVIETEAERRSWGVNEPGLMLEATKYGLVFFPARTLDGGQIEYVSREAAG